MLPYLVVTLDGLLKSDSSMLLLDNFIRNGEPQPAPPRLWSPRGRSQLRRSQLLGWTAHSAQAMNNKKSPELLPKPRSARDGLGSMTRFWCAVRRRHGEGVEEWCKEVRLPLSRSFPLKLFTEAGATTLLTEWRRKLSHFCTFRREGVDVGGQWWASSLHTKKILFSRP